MKVILRPGLLLAALAFLPFISLADTGGAVTAVLRIVGSPVVGGAGAYEGHCRPVLGPAPPEVSFFQTVTLLHDADGDDLLDPGDMVAYTAEVQNLLPNKLENLKLLLVFPSTLEPLSFPANTESKDIGDLWLLEIPLPAVDPYGTSRIGFVARLTEESDVPAIFVQGFLQGEDFTMVADVPNTSIVLDPAAVAVREVAGGGGALFPGLGQFEKTLRGSPVVAPGEEIEVSVSYRVLDGRDEVTLVDILPSPLELIPGSVRPHGAEVAVEGGLTFIRARFSEVSRGQKLTLRYRAAVGETARIPYVATRAMVVFPDGDVVFSDDPRTPEMNDPTAVIYPWTKESWSPIDWANAVQRGNFSIPVVVRRNGDERVLRWVRCGSGALDEATPGDLVFVGLVRVPLRSLPEGGLFGLLVAEFPPPVGTLYIPVEYGSPVFGELSGTVEVVQDIPVPPCGEIYLPILVEIPADFPRKITGVVMDEGI